MNERASDTSYYILAAPSARARLVRRSSVSCVRGDACHTHAHYLGPVAVSVARWPIYQNTGLGTGYIKMLTQRGTSWHVLILQFFRLEPVGVLLSSQLSRLFWHPGNCIMAAAFKGIIRYIRTRKNTNGNFSENNNIDNLFTRNSKIVYLINCIGHNVICIDFAKVII